MVSGSMHLAGPVCGTTVAIKRSMTHIVLDKDSMKTIRPYRVERSFGGDTL